MSSRKMLLFFTGLLLASFSAMLLVVNPALAVTPIGFSFIFTGALAFAFFLDWALSKVMVSHRLVMVPVTLIGMLLTFTSMGAPGWAILAMLLTSIDFAVNAARDKRTRRAAATPPMARAAA